MVLASARCYRQHMRLHIELEAALIAEIDEIAGHRQRSAFVREAVRAAVDQHKRWRLLGRAAGSIPDTGHDWDDDPAEWVHSQRFGDTTRVG